MEQKLTNYVRPTKKDIQNLQKLDSSLIESGFPYSFPALSNRSSESLFVQNAPPKPGVQLWAPGKFAGYFWKDGRDGDRTPGTNDLSSNCLFRHSADREDSAGSLLLAHKNFIGTSHLLGPVAITVTTLDDGMCISIVRTAIVFCVVTIAKISEDEQTPCRQILAEYVDFIAQCHTANDTYNWFDNDFAEQLIQLSVFPTRELNEVHKNLVNQLSSSLSNALFSQFERYKTEICSGIDIISDCSLDSELQAIFGIHLIRRPSKRKLSHKNEPLTRSRRVEELIDSEQKFFDGLTVMAQRYKAELCGLHKCISEEDARKLFINVDDLYNVHEDLLADLKRSAIASQTLAQHFRRMLPVHEKYTQGQSEAVAHFNYLRRNNNGFISTLERLETDQKQQRLENLMIEPIQRIMRYELLLSAILEVTPEDSEEFQSTKDSVDEAKRFASKLDNIRKSKESYDELKQRLQLVEGIPPEILAQNRQYVMSLQTNKINAVSKESIESINLILLNDLLLLVTRERSLMQHKDVFAEQLDIKHVRIRRSHVSSDAFEMTFIPPLTDSATSNLLMRYQGFYKCNSTHELATFCLRLKQQSLGENIVSYIPKTQPSDSKLLLHKVYESEQQWQRANDHSRITILVQSVNESSIQANFRTNKPHAICMVQSNGSASRAFFKTNRPLPNTCEVSDFTELYLQPTSKLASDISQQLGTLDDQLQRYAMKLPIMRKLSLNRHLRLHSDIRTPSPRDFIQKASSPHKLITRMDSLWSLSSWAGDADADDTSSIKSNSSSKGLRAMGTRLIAGTQTLGRSMSVSRKTQSDPELFKCLVDAIENDKGHLTPGIYKDAGNPDTIRKCLDTLSRSQFPRVDKHVHVSDLATVLKRFLPKALNNGVPLIPWVEIAKLNEESDTAYKQLLKKWIDQLDTSSRSVLTRLVWHLHKVSGNEELNYMNCSMLAREFAQCIFPTTSRDLVYLHQQCGDPLVAFNRSTSLTELMISQPLTLAGPAHTRDTTPASTPVTPTANKTPKLSYFKSISRRASNAEAPSTSPQTPRLTPSPAPIKTPTTKNSRLPGPAFSGLRYEVSTQAASTSNEPVRRPLAVRGVTQQNSEESMETTFSLQQREEDMDAVTKHVTEYLMLNAAERSQP